MTRVSQVVWPVIALVASFGAVFALTWLFSAERTPAPEVAAPTTPAPQPDGLVVEVRGVERPTSAIPQAETTIVANVLVFKDGYLCLASSFSAAGWQPKDKEQWTVNQGSCRELGDDEKLDLTFVQKQ